MRFTSDLQLTWQNLFLEEEFVAIYRRHKETFQRPNRFSAISLGSGPHLTLRALSNNISGGIDER